MQIFTEHLPRVRPFFCRCWGQSDMLDSVRNTRSTHLNAMEKLFKGSSLTEAIKTPSANRDHKGVLGDLQIDTFILSPHPPIPVASLAVIVYIFKK